jgi:hypothetical protein
MVGVPPCILLANNTAPPPLTVISQLSAPKLQDDTVTPSESSICIFEKNI